MADETTKSAVAEQLMANVTTAASAATICMSPQHGLHGAIQQPHPSAQQPAAMAGSYPTATYPDVFYTAQSRAVQLMQPLLQPALQPQAQVSQLIKFGPF